jgi:CheY-like chemotaxis protein
MHASRFFQDESQMTGRKLLLADDSVTIQKVIDLTFTDEGMQVTTVSDGEQAINKLKEFTPDIVLADVLMPGLDGYGLCEFIKNSERFRRIPVMLLVGSFEPFDEAEARRVGADDFLTKPFQSIRQLVSRVGSLLGGKPAGEPASTGLSTLGLDQAAARPPLGTPSEDRTVSEPPLNEVVVEEPGIELQTADTLRLPSFAATGAGPAASPYNSLETQPVKTLTVSEATVIAPDFDDALLDLDDLDSIAGTPEVEDSILDLEYIESVELAAPSRAEETQPSFEPAAATAAMTVTQEYERVEKVPTPAAAVEQMIVAGQAAVAEAAAGVAPEARAAEQWVGVEPPTETGATELSPEVVEAIAQRVVEKLSDKVVREIAWEVVPELAELLIKQRLEQKDAKSNGLV